MAGYNPHPGDPWVDAPAKARPLADAIALVNRIVRRFGIANAIGLDDFPKAERLIRDYVDLTLADLGVKA